MSPALSRAGLAELHEVALSHVGPDKVPGLVLLVGCGDQVVVEALGRQAIDGAPVSRDSVFRIASTSKPVTAAAAMVLVEEGLLDLDAPVEGFLPELADRTVLVDPAGPLCDVVAATRPITARDLLTFTFGFGLAVEMFVAPEPWPIIRAADVLDLATLGPPDPALQPDPDTWIARLGSLPLMAQPGERWLYNTGASATGVLLARAAGMPIAEVFASRLFGPLAMSDTAFFCSDPSRLVTAYAPSLEGLVVIDEPNGDWSKRPAFGDAAAGLVSTVDDLHRFAQMMLRRGDGVLSDASVTELTSDQLSAAQKARGGLGPDFFAHQSWGLCQAVQDDGAFGWDGGLGTSFHVDPAYDLCVIVLTQRRFDGPALPQLHRDIRRAAYRALN